ncbi:SLAC1 anion channel family protein [Rhodalgimonas zhirmunskyi]|uniref:SLAC1 anion channel family protein n=1 Tax=Rhodalgimonas zhirmunskyi TaxID=2964767 RepID=A0AAJ1UFL4_9RHOB|nr:SLAC1 anion channel family protein [Rhodoalgimonas zhirmunskyi]MDQ2095012.1 SLAC1 anion channel family protein [Rhodoalgimonas zhirmunskyi]
MTATQDQHAQGSSLQHYPVPLFGMIMGFAGLTLATHGAEAAFQTHLGASTAIYYVTFALFLLVGGIYLLKAIRYPAAVAAEWKHPVRLAFFPAISISLLLLATATLSRDKQLALWLWGGGAALQFVLTIAVISNWIGTRSFQHGHLNPAWFIPAVGNVIVPIAGAQLGYADISWYFMSVGLIFWIVLLTLVINRLVFHDPMPARLQPSLVILIAPPAVAFVAWMKLNGGQIDAFAQILINAAYFFVFLVLVQLPRIIRLNFAISFWALSFPFAAATIASFQFAAAAGSMVHKYIGLGLWCALVLIIVVLIYQTIKAALAGEICVPE